MLLLTSSASATKTQCEDTHGHDTAALSAVDVGVICEDIRDGLRGVRSEGHCDVAVVVVVVEGWLCGEDCLIDIVPIDRNPGLKRGRECKRCDATILGTDVNGWPPRKCGSSVGTEVRCGRVSSEVVVVIVM